MQVYINTHSLFNNKVDNTNAANISDTILKANIYGIENGDSIQYLRKVKH